MTSIHSDEFDKNKIGLENEDLKTEMSIKFVFDILWSVLTSFSGKCNANKNLLKERHHILKNYTIYIYIYI